MPNGRLHCAFHSQTRSPTRLADTSGPTASISPAPSLCGMMRVNAMVRPVLPLRPFTSDGLMPDARTRTRTSPAPGEGVGTSATRNTSRAGPCVS